MEAIKRLSTLLNFVHTIEVQGNRDLPVRGLAYHTERVEPGFLFFCLEGTRFDGHDFIHQAIQAGAIAIVMEKNVEVRGATKILVPHVRTVMAAFAQLFYGNPSENMRLIGVTGTNGKTTTTHLIEAIAASQGRMTGLLGTIQYKIAGKSFPVLATTPEAPDLQKMLWTMRETDVDYVVMEVSSHALELSRVSGCDFDIAVLTNVTADHLDFHGEFTRYLSAKGKLFAQLGGSFLKHATPRYAVINADDKNASFFQRQATTQWITYGMHQPAVVSARNIVIRNEGVSFQLISPWGEAAFSLKLTGNFSVYNALAASTVGLLEGVPLPAIKEVLENIEGIPGRFEKIDRGQDFLVIIDYAHTPDGLENVLQAARGFAGGKIITVFGCGGERDRAKRPVMGRIAGHYSDYCILTSDNPRGEDPWQIIHEVQVGLQEEKAFGSGYAVQADRREAIKLAVELARPGDIVIIAGKGHEDYQIFADYTVPFSDREVASEMILQRVKP